MQFQGFKPQAMERIAGTLGYQGDMEKFKDFLQTDPEAQMKFNDFQNKAIQMMNGGMVRKNYGIGGAVTTGVNSGVISPSTSTVMDSDGVLGNEVTTPVEPETPASIGQTTVNRMQGPALPVGGIATATGTVAQTSQDLAAGAGQVSTTSPTATATQGTVAQATAYDPRNEFRMFDPRPIKEPMYNRPIIAYNPNLPISDTNFPQPRYDQPMLGGGPQLEGANDSNFRDRGEQHRIATFINVIENSPEFKAKEAFLQTFAGREPTQAEIEQLKKLELADKNSSARQNFDANYKKNFPQPVIAGQLARSGYMPAIREGIAEVDPTKTAGTVEGVLDQTQTPTGTVSDDAQVTGQQQTETAVSTVDAAQGTALKMDNPVQRELQAGEIIEPAANAEKASKFTEQIQAATATPSDRATVKGQLDTLMADFEGGETPAWAAGALRNATAQMAARGLGASSMAGQALVQAAMESALPIASADAQTVAGFEIKNLSNRQERAMLSAQQRATFMGMEFDQAFQSRVANAAKVSDIANMNFTAEQQVALENSRAANTMNLSNLSNRQALTMAEASSLANLDMANLSNRQAAAVMNAQSFLAMDMTNLANQQQTEMFKAQQRTQSMFTDQAAENAAKQFNATSENQSDQFFANLKTQTSQFNTSQANAMSQFNAGEENAVKKFNTEIANQRDQFNAQNGLVIAQSNAVWRREIATAATAAVNRANEINAAAVLDMSNQAYSNLWQEHADMMEWAWTSSDNERDRQNAVTLSNLAAGNARSAAEYQADVQSSSAIGDFVSKLALGYAGKVFGF